MASRFSLFTSVEADMVLDLMDVGPWPVRQLDLDVWYTVGY